jgi:hypothetical protein
MSRACGLRLVRLRAALAPFVVVAAGCFVFGHGRPQAGPVPGVREGEIALNVTNHNYLDIVIYVLHDGQQTRVGTVTGSSSAIFYLQAWLVGQGHEVRLYGAPIGSTSHASTETLIVQPGQIIEWTLETDLRRSSVAVY